MIPARGHLAPECVVYDEAFAASAENQQLRVCVTVSIDFNAVSKRFSLQRERARSFQDLLLSLPERWRGGWSGREDFWVLRDVSFDIRSGEAVGLIGANGAGKSTALKLMSRIIEPTSGTVQVSGRVGALLELGAGFHPDLTGRENVYLNGSILGLGRNEIDRKLDEIVAFAELERFIDVPVKHYSSGMYVRLGFSVAVHTEPEVLLIDEVLAVGDQTFQHKCLDRILDIRRQGVTICFVSHDLESVRRLCSRAIWLEGGRIQAAGNVSDTISAYLQHEAEEEEARAADGVTGGRDDERRWGTGAIRVVGVDFLDARGSIRRVFQSGDTWAVRLRYQARDLVKSPIFGLAVYRNDGVHVCGPNTGFGGLQIPFVQGEGEIVYRVDHLPLMEGTYQVSVSAHDEADTTMYDFHDRLYAFAVRQTGSAERYGLVSLDGRWEQR
jgi:ABC-type polysaccharide/polyol phosphate transport system ATPase subunit